MAERTRLEPLTFSGLPSCEDCLAWCEDHLAIAVGGEVHICTPQRATAEDNTKPDDWHIETIRVNHFQQNEWPHRELATLSKLSLGEEQSGSSVINLGWSPPGLGQHRRSVLAILTSNLVLSLWETDGTSGNWRRSHIVNTKLEDSSTGSAEFKRRSQRTRAFTWLPTLKYPSTVRWGMHWLLAMDDNSSITCYRVERDYSISSDLRISRVYQNRLWTSEQPELGGQTSHLQGLLATQSPTTRITTGPWQTLQNEENLTEVFQIRLIFRRGSAEGPPADSSYLLGVAPTAAGIEFTGQGLSPNLTPGHNDLLSTQPFEQVVTRLVEKFSAQHNLDSRVRIRHWGFASSPVNDLVAKCITLYPIDMIANTTSSDAETVVVFARADRESSDFLPLAGVTPAMKLLSWLRAHTSKQHVKSELDMRIVKVAASVVYAIFSHDDKLMEWSRSAGGLLSPSAQDGMEVNGDVRMSDAANETPSHHSPFVPASTIAETCEMCDSNLLMTSDLASARCLKGHLFTRCGISFVAIQEPGISKYCSRCGKQFLDLLKLEPLSGPSLAHALFEEFDVCPYCQGKFRG